MINNSPILKRILPARLTNLYRQTIAGDNPPLGEFYPIQVGKSKNFSGREYGSHHADHLSLTLEMLWPHLQDGGVYIIEDTHTSYWKEYGGGYLKNQTIVEFVKDAIDTIHQLYTRKKMPVRTEFLRDSLASITFFDSIIVLRKAKTTPPQRVSFE